MILRERGFTLLEMLLTATVLLVIASSVLTLTGNAVRRERERTLLRGLRELRAAIDAYKEAADQKRIKPPSPATNGYPESLEALVEGVPAQDKPVKVRFLRRIPVDPLTGRAAWGLRSMADDPLSGTWGGGDVFDVYSLAPGTGSNAVPYRQW
jgi:general secretion pathway protein G